MAARRRKRPECCCSATNPNSKHANAPAPAGAFACCRDLRLAGDADDGQVVVLAVLLGDGGDAGGGGPLVQKGFDSGKPEERALRITGFGNSVGEEDGAIADAHFEGGVRVGCGFGQAERQGAGKRELGAVEIERRMAGVGECEMSSIFKPDHDTSGETAVGAAKRSAVDFGKDFGGLLGKAGDGGDHSDQHGDDHGGAKALAADVADDDERSAAGERDHLEEVATDLRGGAVDTFNGVASDRGQGFRNHDALDLARGGHFAFEGGLLGLDADVAAAFIDGGEDESRVSQAGADDDGGAVESKAAMEAAGTGGAQAGEPALFVKEIGDQRHADSLGYKYDRKGLPELALQADAGGGV